MLNVNDLSIKSIIFISSLHSSGYLTEHCPLQKCQNKGQEPSDPDFITHIVFVYATASGEEDMRNKLINVLLRLIISSV